MPQGQEIKSCAGTLYPPQGGIGLIHDDNEKKKSKGTKKVCNKKRTYV